MAHHFSPPGMVRCVCAASALLAAALASGCHTQYVTPGRAADFHALGITPEHVEVLTDTAIAESMSKRPLASFPATIAVLRIQDASYSGYHDLWHGTGRYRSVTLRDAEIRADLERLQSLPMIRGIVPLNRLVIPSALNSQEDIRGSAAAVHADMTLLFTFDTRFGTETIVPALGTITLGLFPSREARVTCTASAALIDTRNGYVYAVAESTAEEDQLANSWTSKDAVDQSRRRAERNAFRALLVELERAWSGVVAQYAPALSGSP